jgi:GNAT superfamily N-acetyltransferase
MIVRPSTPHDLAAAAVMHHRCSARSLLGRYRLGGRPPTVIALDRQLRAPLSFVAALRDDPPQTGAIVATALLVPDPRHGPRSVEAGILVEDSWQGQGIGRELIKHLAGAAVLAGFGDLVAYPGGSARIPGRLLAMVGITRMIDDDGGGHLHAALPMRAVEQLGPVRVGGVADEVLPVPAG